METTMCAMSACLRGKSVDTNLNDLNWGTLILWVFQDDNVVDLSLFLSFCSICLSVFWLCLSTSASVHLSPLLSIYVLSVFLSVSASVRICLAYASVSSSAGSPSRGADVAVNVFDINQPSLPTPLYSVLVSVFVFMTLSTVFHSINSPDNSPLSHSVFPVLFEPYWSFKLYISSWKFPSALI